MIGEVVSKACWLEDGVDGGVEGLIEMVDKACWLGCRGSSDRKEGRMMVVWTLFKCRCSPSQPQHWEHIRICNGDRYFRGTLEQ